MFITELFESEQRRLVVVYPGRFQPFHQGHAGVFAKLQGQFGRDNCYIATTPNVRIDDRNPFNASEKVALMHAAGITNDRIKLITEPYKIEAITEGVGFDPNNTVLIFAVGAPDRDRLDVDRVYTEFTPTGRASKIPQGKQVGDAKPMKTYSGNFNECVTVAEGHAYVVVVPEIKIPFELNGQKYDLSHGTECRNMWNQVRNDPQWTKTFLTKLYGRATPELVSIFNKIALPAATAEPAQRPTKLPKTPEPAGGLDKAAKRANRLMKEDIAKDPENFNGIDISMEIQKDDEYVDDEDYDNQVLYVTASSKGKELGHVLFAFDGEYLMPQDLEVEEKYRGQGIAQIMYDYVKSKGYKIRRSGQQTDAGAGFWDKHKPGKNVWEQGVAEGSLNEFATGNGGGESGRWYTDDQMTDIVGDGWWNDLDVSGDISKQQMIQQAQAWLDDQGYSVQVLNCKVNDDDMEWYIEGNFHNPGFAKKDVAEAFSQAAADKNKIKYQKAGRIGHGVGWKDYGDDYSSLVSDIVNKFDNITRLVQYDQAPEPTKYKIVERFFKKYGYPFELFNDVITAIEKRVAGETNRYSEQGVAEGLNESLSSMVDQDQAERKEYATFVKSQAGGDWPKGAKMYAQLKKRSSNDIFDDASRLNQFMKMKFDFDKFTNEDWNNYWLLAQHCDYNRNFQKNALSIIKKYQGTDHSHYKYLYDRISMSLTGKQKYGTQNVIEQGVAESLKFRSKQECIDYFVRQGKSSAQGAAAWERMSTSKPKTVKPFDPNKHSGHWWQKDENINEIGGVGVVKSGNDPRYSMSTAGDQNAVTGNTLGKEMQAFGLIGRKNPGINNQQKSVKKSVGQGKY